MFSLLFSGGAERQMTECYGKDKENPNPKSEVTYMVNRYDAKEIKEMHKNGERNIFDKDGKAHKGDDDKDFTIPLDDILKASVKSSVAFMKDYTKGNDLVKFDFIHLYTLDICDFVCRKGSVMGMRDSDIEDGVPVYVEEEHQKKLDKWKMEWDSNIKILNEWGELTRDYSGSVYEYVDMDKLDLGDDKDMALKSEHIAKVADILNKAGVDLSIDETTKVSDVEKAIKNHLHVLKEKIIADVGMVAAHVIETDSQLVGPLSPSFINGVLIYHFNSRQAEKPLIVGDKIETEAGPTGTVSVEKSGIFNRILGNKKKLVTYEYIKNLAKPEVVVREDRRTVSKKTKFNTGSWHCLASTLVFRKGSDSPTRADMIPVLGESVIPMLPFASDAAFPGKSHKVGRNILMRRYISQVIADIQNGGKKGISFVVQMPDNPGNDYMNPETYKLVFSDLGFKFSLPRQRCKDINCSEMIINTKGDKKRDMIFTNYKIVSD